MGRIIGLILVLSLISACEQTDTINYVEAANPETIRTIKNGKIIGSITENGAHRWARIPFAAPPVGDLRWRAPLAASNWSTTLPALDSGTRCLQIGDGTEAQANSSKLSGSEDCLYLNVWAPAFSTTNIPTAKDSLPVMVFIHGGGNRSGFGGQYNSEIIAKEHNIVAVTINYRLGPLGWFSHDALQDSAKGGIENSPNYGTLDIILALKWVQENIAAFGGNPDRVTIYGESAGGHNIASLLAMKQAQGLFHGAIIQSGYFTSRSISGARKGIREEDGWKYMGTEQIMTRLNTPANASPSQMATFLRELTPTQLFAAAAGSDGEPESAMVIRDGILIPKEGIEFAIETADFAIVPLITGTNRDEIKLFNMSNPDFVKLLPGGLPRVRDQQMYDRIAMPQSLMWRVRAVDEQARRISAKQQNPVFGYRFDWDEQDSFLGSDFAHLLGAAHAMELPFIFGIFDTFPSAKQLFPAKGKAEREQLSKIMRSYWAQFAYNKNPARGRNNDLPLWGSWQSAPDNGQIMIFDSASSGGAQMSEQTFTAKDVYRHLGKSTRDLDQQDKCLILEGVIGWFPETKHMANLANIGNC